MSPVIGTEDPADILGSASKRELGAAACLSKDQASLSGLPGPFQLSPPAACLLMGRPCSSWLSTQGSLGWGGVLGVCRSEPWLFAGSRASCREETGMRQLEPRGPSLQGTALAGPGGVLLPRGLGKASAGFLRSRPSPAPSQSHSWHVDEQFEPTSHAFCKQLNLSVSVYTRVWSVCVCVCPSPLPVHFWLISGAPLLQLGPPPGCLMLEAPSPSPEAECRAGQPGVEDPDWRPFHLLLASFLPWIPVERTGQRGASMWAVGMGMDPKLPPGASHLPSSTRRSSGEQKQKLY